MLFTSKAIKQLQKIFKQLTEEITDKSDCCCAEFYA